MKNKNEIVIPNHISAKLSEMDMAIVHSVPPGGNWKNIPETVPSKRIAQIRAGYEKGEGSRSTYYGRLLPSMPSYTINTYFNRPGNGCHIHYSQNRVLSQREAARLQSFPDSFLFKGSQTAINTQIGNAVPPLLAFQIAKQLTKVVGEAGVFIDLFSGAGGMGLGFKWAGWKPLLANDIEPKFIETYSLNVHSNTIVGSITDKEVFNSLVMQCKNLRLQNPNKAFWVLGGPPCQGFSTAGNKRSMDDQRNLLFINYRDFIEEVKPDGFVFENVSGLLNMEKGKIFERVKSEFRSLMPSLVGWVLNSEDYAIPQRRKRVILVGANKLGFNIDPPKVITKKLDDNNTLSNIHSWISVKDALSDLPALNQNEDGSYLIYCSEPHNPYQKLMRGLINAEEYLSNYLEKLNQV
ncbi:DNA (cytosine-5-)-methyltransferase [Legionella pneumophila serogroup 1]